MHRRTGTDRKKILYIYMNHIIHCKIKRDNHQVPKIVRVPGNKTNSKIIKWKFTNKASNYCFYWKNGSSNLLVERTYSVVALRTFVLASVSNEVLPKRRTLIKTGLHRSRRLLSILSMVLRRVGLSLIHVRQWRRKCAVDWISKPQLQSGFKESWKLCLNLCLRKWLKPSHSLLINLIPLRLWQLKRLLTDGLINFRKLFQKILKLVEFLMLWSSLFHSIIVDRKKDVLF